MKCIGILGGMSWESTVPYYQSINQTVRQRLGKLHSANLILYSVDFQAVAEMQASGDWEAAGRLLANAARRLEQAGADIIVLATNTMHKVASAIEEATEIPLLHIADATAAAAKRQNLACLGLLGTQFTMEEAFYRQRLEQHGLQVRTPPEADRQVVHRVIYEELCQGQFLSESREAYLQIIDQLAEPAVADDDSPALPACQAIILGCTEIGLLVKTEHTRLPLLNTTTLHAEAAVDFALGAAT